MVGSNHVCYGSGNLGDSTEFEFELYNRRSFQLPKKLIGRTESTSMSDLVKGGWWSSFPCIPGADSVSSTYDLRLQQCDSAIEDVDPQCLSNQYQRGCGRRRQRYQRTSDPIGRRWGIFTDSRDNPRYTIRGKCFAALCGAADKTPVIDSSYSSSDCGYSVNRTRCEYILFMLE